MDATPIANIRVMERYRLNNSLVNVFTPRDKPKKRGPRHHKKSQN